MVVLSTSHTFDQVNLEFEFGTSNCEDNGRVENLESGIGNRETETETETRLEI